MKRILTSLSAISMMGLTACSTNTQNENTGVGAVGGAVVGGLAGSLVGGGTGRDIAIGVGAIAGALIGGTIGHRMDHDDNRATTQVIKDNSTNQTTSWVNARTGVAYTMTPTSDLITVKGNPNCRRYHFTATQNGNTSTFNGTACQMKNGKWYRVK